jgi:hypothetical protein
MAKSAVTGLTEHLESIRREAYTEGYAAAMRAVVEFSTSRTAKPKYGHHSAFPASPNCT